MRRAVYAGSFDPITLGHLWMIEQGARLFEELVVAIGVNPEKKYSFPISERLETLRAVVSCYQNVTVSEFQNLFLVHYARQMGADFILRGIRNEQASDDQGPTRTSTPLERLVASFGSVR